MLDAHSLAPFLVAVVLLNVTPGPDMLYIVTRSLTQGSKAGIVSAFGTSLGYAGHTFAAAVGLSGLLMSSTAAFDAVRFAGAAYLLYLGIHTIAQGQAPNPQAPVKREDLRSVFRQGLLTNTLNPKVALFFLALLPQFVEPSAGSVTCQFVMLGLIIMCSAFFFGVVLAVAAGRMGGALRRHPRVSRGQQWVTGGLFVALGLRLALSKRSA